MNATADIEFDSPVDSAVDSETRHALIDEGLKASFWSMALPGGLEREYLQACDERRFQQTFRSGWLALLIFDAFLLVDWLMANDVFALAAFIRLVVFTPLCVAVLVLAPRWRRWARQVQSLYYVDWVILLSGWGATFCLAAILYHSHNPLSNYYHAGFLIIIVYGTVVQRMTFRFATVFVSGVLFMHIGGILLVPNYPPAIRLAMIEMLTVSGAFCLAANYLVEKARRRRYLLLRREQTLVEDLGDLNRQLLHLSRSDVLTGVANRRHFHEHLQGVWTRGAGDAAPVAILMIDVDHFKAYNDLYGHPAGDECLRQVSQALEASVRQPADFVARYGGEEFVVVMPDCDPDTAHQVAERVRAAVEHLALPHEGSSVGPSVTVSIGVSSCVPDGLAASAERLLSQADHALYDAKHAGRNRVCALSGS